MTTEKRAKRTVESYYAGYEMIYELESIFMEHMRRGWNEKND